MRSLALGGMMQVLERWLLAFLCVLGCCGQTGVRVLGDSGEQDPWECGWYHHIDHWIFDLSSALPQTGRMAKAVG